MEYKSIKIPNETYEAIQLARVELARKGLGGLPIEIREPKTCAFCGTTLERSSVKYEYLRCPKCNYKQQSINADVAGAFALGGLIGLGIAALAYLLEKKGDE